MIVTVTMNPALDKTAETDRLVLGGLNRLEHITVDAGGKGINVSKTIAALGGHSLATGFLGGNPGREIEAALKAMHIETDFVSIENPSRTNMKVLSREHGITELNEPGPAIRSDEMDALTEKLRGYAKPGVFFVFSGSLPVGVEPDTYETFIHSVRQRGAKVFLDADGEAFRRALLAMPDLIKPNKEELAQYAPMAEEPSIDAYAALCLDLCNQGIETVVLSMGSQGALFANGTTLLYAPGLPVQVQSTVGAGDSMVGALVYAFDQGMSLEDAAVLAMAVSAGAVMTSGTKPPSLAIVESLKKQVVLTPIISQRKV